MRSALSRAIRANSRDALADNRTASRLKVNLGLADADIIIGQCG